MASGERYTEILKHFQRGLDFFEGGFLDDAINELTMAISLAETHDTTKASTSLIYNARGGTAYLQGKFSEAIADFEMALRLDPDNVECIDNIAAAKQARGW